MSTKSAEVNKKSRSAVFLSTSEVSSHKVVGFRTLYGLTGISTFYLPGAMSGPKKEGKMRIRAFPVSGCVDSTVKMIHLITFWEGNDGSQVCG